MLRFLRFAVAGTLGFLTDMAVLTALLHATPLGPFVARILSIAVALLVTWSFNRRFTFGPSRRHVAAEGARYAAVAAATSLFNYIVYSAALIAFPGLWPQAALAIASIAAIAASFLGYSRLVFDR